MPQRLETHERGAKVSPARAFVAGGLALAALGGAGGGVYFGLLSQSDAKTAGKLKDSLNSGSNACYRVTSTTCTALSNAAHDQGEHKTWSDRFYVASGVLAASAIATWFLWPRPSGSRTALHVAPAIGSGGLTLDVAAEF
jgi:hypothetical protein